MIDITRYIESGILELYVLGNITDAEKLEVEQMAIQHPAIANELSAINKALQTYATAYSLTPGVTIKPAVLSTIDFIERLQNGEPVSFPPPVHEGSKIADYAAWINRNDMVLPVDFVDIFVKVLAHTEQSTLAIIWLKTGSPVEVHHDKLESFLIVEGSCIITIEQEEFPLKVGDVLTIPLHKKHFVTVTSPFACKVILQRAAA